MATSAPASSAGSSVYGCPPYVRRPAKSGFSPKRRQRSRGSIIPRSSQTALGRGEIVATARPEPEVALGLDATAVLHARDEAGDYRAGRERHRLARCSMPP